MTVSSPRIKYKISIEIVYHETEHHALENSAAYQGPVELAVSVFEGTPQAVVAVVQLPVSCSAE